MRIHITRGARNKTGRDNVKSAQTHPQTEKAPIACDKRKGAEADFKKCAKDDVCAIVCVYVNL